MDTDNHVLDQGSQGSHGTSGLLRAEPHAETNPCSLSLFAFLFHKLNLARNVTEVLSNLTSSALAGNFSC